MIIGYWLTLLLAHVTVDVMGGAALTAYCERETVHLANSCGCELKPVYMCLLGYVVLGCEAV